MAPAETSLLPARGEKFRMSGRHKKLRRRSTSPFPLSACSRMWREGETRVAESSEPRVRRLSGTPR